MWRTASVLVGVALILSTLGIIMLASTSAIFAQQHYGDPHFFVKRQVVAFVLALMIGFISIRLDYHYWQQLAIPLTVVAVLGLMLALTPWIGVRAGGSNRWIRIGPLTFQPSEAGKLAVIALLSWYLARTQRYMHQFFRGLFLPFVMIGIVAIWVFISPDFGTTMLLWIVGMMLMFAGGTRISYLVTFAALGAVGLTIAIMNSPVRLRRVIAFLNPDKYAQEEAFQLLSAKYAFITGGGWGVGLGQSIQKRFYLPESHTDFIFAIIGEELGVAASLSVVLLFAVLFVAGMRVAWGAPDLFGRLLALGITLMITIQAAVNIAVVSGVVPTKGLPLPFISYGGSSILMTCIMVGILVNIALEASARDVA